MIFNFTLSDDEVDTLDRGGVIVITFPDGIRIIVKKEEVEEEKL